MAASVSGAFSTFRIVYVDLGADATSKARTSRDHLATQLKSLNSTDSDCPKIYSHLNFGSFARRTKIEPLNDIDLLANMSSSGLRPDVSPSNSFHYWLKIVDNNCPLASFTDAYGYLSSIKILNQLKKSLGRISSYRKAEINRNQQAVVLNLTSYSWSFDIVPALPKYDAYGTGSVDYYFIPNGNGNWMRTDPRRDTEYVTRVSKQHDGQLLPTMRLLKYWNWRTHKPRLQSYYFETLCLKVFDHAPKITNYQNAVKYFFLNCPYYLDQNCPDPKLLGPALDKDVTWDTKRSVKSAMQDAHQYAINAINYESVGSTRSALDSWRLVFGPSFPTYG